MAPDLVNDVCPSLALPVDSVGALPGDLLTTIISMFNDTAGGLGERLSDGPRRRGGGNREESRIRPRVRPC